MLRSGQASDDDYSQPLLPPEEEEPPEEPPEDPPVALATLTLLAFDLSRRFSLFCFISLRLFTRFVSFLKSIFFSFSTAFVNVVL